METKNNANTEAEEPLQDKSKGSLTVKRNKKVDFFAKICCLIIAFFIWLFAAENDTTQYNENFSSIPVEIVNTSGFSVLSGDDATVDVTVSGKRSLISRLTRSDIRAYVDMSAITAPGRYRFDLQVELPNGVSLSKASLDSVTVYADNTTSVTVPVKVNVTKFLLEDGYELDTADTVTNPKTVTVTGPESVLQSITEARLDADIGHVTRTVTYSGDLVLVDGAGNEVTNSYIRMSASYVTATIPVYKYREVPIEVIFKNGLFNPSNCEATVTPSSIRILGDAEAVDAVRLEYEIDEKRITASTNTYTVKITLPEGVENVSMIDTATISLTLKGVATKKISVTDFRVVNPQNLNYEPLVDPLSITVQGETALVNRIGSANVTAVVDLSNQESFAGTVIVPVSFEFSAPYSGLVYEVGSYSVSVKILG